jgi:4-hydroxy-tetrahydrodipicolinate synthase
MKERFGLSAALTTPFETDGAVDISKMATHAKGCLERGCASVTLFGTTGEGASIGHRERAAILGGMTAAGIPAARFVYGVAETAVENATVEAAKALVAGCGYVLLPPPFYFKAPSEDGIVGWYDAVLSGLGSLARDVILYHIPSVTAVPLTVSVVRRVADAHPEAVVGVKDSGGDWAFTEALLAARGILKIMVGDERDLARAVRCGAEGAISGMANIATRRMLGLANDGRDDSALVDVVKMLLTGPVTPAVKALVGHVTGDASWGRTRPPLDPTPAAALKPLVALFDANLGR